MKVTKKAIALSAKYDSAACESLDEAYASGGSRRTRAAEKAIREEMAELGGFGFRITGATTSHFSCAYLYKEKDGTVTLVTHTVANRYVTPYVR